MAPVWREVDLDFDSGAALLVQAHREDGRARDLPVMDLRLHGITGDDGHFVLRPLMAHEPPRPLRSAAFSALCARLGAPVEFVRDKLPAPIQLATLNWLMSQPERSSSATLRLRGEVVSAIVSERYAPLDPADMVDALRAALVRHGRLQQVRVRAVATGLTDVLRLVLPAEEIAVEVGDVTAAGIDITTSSFGRAALSVRGSLWRLRCKNGLRTPSTLGEYSFRHIGDAQRLRDGLSDAVPSAIAHARGLLGRWQRAVNVYVEQLADYIQGLRELTFDERSGVQSKLLAELGTAALPERTSVYALTNAVTSAAHDADPGRRIELESFAGELLSRHVGAGS